MTEVEATVESEHVPEAKWPELPDRVFVWQVPNETGSRAVCIESDQHLKDCVDDAERRCERYFILRVSPPVERRAEIGESELAKCVNDFAAGMLAKLMTPKNRAKGDRQGWLSMEMGELKHRLFVELSELREAIEYDATIESIEDEARDVANFAMMIADKARHARVVEVKP